VLEGVPTGRYHPIPNLVKGRRAGVEKGAAVPYGRSDEDWKTLAAATEAFLVERAAMRQTTSYTELNAVLIRRTGLAGFDFALDNERAALGELLGQVSENAAADTGGLLISALVQYLNANDAGPGFYSLARQRGLDVPSNSDARQVFWAKHVDALHERYAPPRRRRPTGQANDR
jgi:hypothetical protein